MLDFLNNEGPWETGYKLLALNDSGEAKGHQAGIVIPKNICHLFPQFSQSLNASHPTREIYITANIFIEDKLVANGEPVRYQSQSWGGNRPPENRITSGTNSFRNISQKDDCLIIQKHLNKEAYRFILLQKGSEKYNYLGSLLSNYRKRWGTIDHSLLSNESEEQPNTTTKEVVSAKIRTAGRHILTIGRELIQNKHAAILELVKNAYDADSPDVMITFRKNTKTEKHEIIISDNGHGMSIDTVLTKWLVSSTDDKLIRKISPKGRTMQGRKGVGRYASSILGDDLLMNSVTEDGMRTRVYVQWMDFEEAEYIDDVDILVENTKCNSMPGTTLTISLSDDSAGEWTSTDFDDLRFELKKLIPPVESIFKSNKDNGSFKIYLIIKDWLDCLSTEEEISPVPIFDFYDYKISGYVSNCGKGKVVYSSQKARNELEENIDFNYGKPTACGNLHFDIRVYDRDPDSISQIIGRGLKNEHGNYIGKNEARNILSRFNGIGVYRNGFRIRPLGDADFDWLELNSRRVQNPSFNIGINQVIGYVSIESEEQSNLFEKAARDGLKENDAYKNLLDITRKIVSELERRRFVYRKKAGIGRVPIKAEDEIEKLSSFENLKNGIRLQLVQKGIDEETTKLILKKVEIEEQKQNHIADELRQIVASYQGQATLGNIVRVVLHEGRKPLGFFKNRLSLIKKWGQYWKETQQIKYLDKLESIIEVWHPQTELLISLFDRLDPLASRGRSDKEFFNVKKEIEKSFEIFKHELESREIKFELECNSELKMMGWAQDLSVILTNLIDNSIFWMTHKGSSVKIITIVVESQDNNLLNIDYFDTGPGIEPYLIESGVIFDPDFSTKKLSNGNQGTGLGLAISGEAAKRNGLKLSAVQSETGAYFRLNNIIMENENE